MNTNLTSFAMTTVLTLYVRLAFPLIYRFDIRFLILWGELGRSELVVIYTYTEVLFIIIFYLIGLMGTKVTLISYVKEFLFYLKQKELLTRESYGKNVNKCDHNAFNLSESECIELFTFLYLQLPFQF